MLQTRVLFKETVLIRRMGFVANALIVKDLSSAARMRLLYLAFTLEFLHLVDDAFHTRTHS